MKDKLKKELVDLLLNPNNPIMNKLKSVDYNVVLYELENIFNVKEKSESKQDKPKSDESKAEKSEGSVESFDQSKFDENGQRYIYCNMAGYVREQLDVKYKNNTIIINGESNLYGRRSISKVITLTENERPLKFTLKDGVLSILIKFENNLDKIIID